jgi:hypothetical protein
MTIQELEEELRKKKFEAKKKAWEDWHTEGRRVLDKMIGKAFIWKNSKETATLFKVISYDVQGVHGCSHPGYFVVKTEGYFTIRCASWSSAFTFPTGDGRFGTFPVIAVNKKKKSENISMLEYVSRTLGDSCSLEDSRLVTIGRYGQKPDGRTDSDIWACLKDVPERSVREEIIGLMGYEISDELYREMRAIAMSIAETVANFWELHKEEIENAPRFNP